MEINQEAAYLLLKQVTKGKTFKSPALVFRLLLPTFSDPTSVSLLLIKSHTSRFPPIIRKARHK